MAELATLARPYARAAFQSALDRGDEAISRFAYQLSLMTECVQQPTLRNELSSPARVASGKVDLLRQVLADDLGDDGANFISVLAEHDRLLLLPEIQRQFEQQRALYERVLEVEVIAARDLSEADQDTLRERLTRRFERRVTLTTRTDASLIGGAVIRAGDTVIDGSVRRRLTRLAESLGVANRSAGSASAA